jgi:hypothetical protein
MAGVKDLIAMIEERRQTELERRISAYPRNNPIASDLGPCTREMALAMLHWKERPLFGPDLKARFERGNLIENAVLNELAALGITVRVERRPFEILDRRREKLIMRGKIDGFVQYDGRDYPMEVKSLDPNIFRQIHAVEDFTRYGFMAKYPKQLQSYLYNEAIDEGFFLLDDCTGRWKLIPVTLDLVLVEAILQQCEAAVEAVSRVRAGAGEADVLPAYHEDPSVCRRCWCFGRVCTPPAEYHGLAMETDPEFEAQLDRRAELEKAHKEYEDLDKAVKARVRGKDGLVVGNYLIQGKALTTAYKAQPERTVEQWRTTITRITGGDS